MDCGLRFLGVPLDACRAENQFLFLERAPQADSPPVSLRASSVRPSGCCESDGMGYCSAVSTRFTPRSSTARLSILRQSALSWKQGGRSTSEKGKSLLHQKSHKSSKQPAKVCHEDVICQFARDSLQLVHWSKARKKNVHTTTVEALLFLQGLRPRAWCIRYTLSGPMVCALFPFSLGNGTHHSCFLNSVVGHNRSRDLVGISAPEKIFSPPPPANTLPAPQPPASDPTPLPGIFNKKTEAHPLLAPRTPPSLTPSRKKQKNIRNVHQGEEGCKVANTHFFLG